VVAGFEVRLPKRPPAAGCEVAAFAPGSESVGGLGWELFKLAKRDMMGRMEMRVRERGGGGGEEEKKAEGEEQRARGSCQSKGRSGMKSETATTRKQWRCLDAQKRDAEQCLLFVPGW
jgi:hypothetical protein